MRNLVHEMPETVQSLSAESVQRPTPTQVLEHLGVELIQTPGDDEPQEARRSGEVMGRFEVIGELGVGGMGRVVEAIDPELRRTVAIKIVRDSDHLTDQHLSRFVAEAQITSQLQHPSIVPVYDLGVTTAGFVYFAMQKVDGESLGQLLRSQRKAEAAEVWPLRRLLHAFVRICQGVAYAHDRGVLHRDLKPDNVMLGSFGEVFVVDWGLARLTGDSTENLAETDGKSGPDRSVSLGATHRTRHGAVIGTPGYMSPEQGRGELDRLDARSDVWSLGAILYEILSFERAVPPAEISKMLQQVEDGEITEVTTRNPARSVPDEIAQVCRRAMAAEPSDRYEDALALAAAVEAFLDGSLKAEQAHSRVADAAAILERVATQRAQAAARLTEAAELLSGVAPNAPETEKAAGWALEDKAAALEAAASLDEIRFTQAAQEALELVPGFASAAALLADYYLGRHRVAEQAGAESAAAGYMLQLEAHDDGSRADYIRGKGRLTLRTEPPAASAALHRYVPSNRRLVLEPVGDLGPTPLADVELPRGSYVLELAAPGRATVRYPFTIERLGHHDASVTIALPLAQELGEDDVYVPAGWALTGGDPLAAGTFPPRRIWLDALVVRRHPVTWGEWIDYLNALVEEGDADEAAARVPREMSDDSPLLIAEDASGYTLPDASPWTRQMPVAHIDWDSARAYADWLAARSGKPWRLLSELEWEKAARGVDGRPFPWGHHHDPSWCNVAESHSAPIPETVGARPVDQSPYGVEGLAGGMRDWCLDAFAPEGPPVGDDMHFSVPEPVGGDVPHITRGGAWSLPDWVGRLCCRGFHPPIRLPDLGMRLAYSAP